MGSLGARPSKWCRGAFFAFFLVWLGGCAESNRLVVYADPWLGEFPARALAAFSAEQPATQVELRILSSEVVAQRLHYGDPIDIFLCFRPEIMRERGLSRQIAAEMVLADLDLVVVAPRVEIRQPKLGAINCQSLPADGRPLQRYIADWSDAPEDSCTVTADFCRQTQDYLLRGWTGRGILPGFFARRHADRLEILRAGPSYSGAFTALKISETPHRSPAVDFMKFLATKKCQSLLAEENIIE
ncbi:MAG: hypothetical protein AAGN35_17005 [Bacteroidota bacterium]